MKRKKQTDKNSKQKQPESSTEVNFRLEEPRETVGFKCNKKLWKAFVRFSRANYGSVCHVLEPVMVAILTSRVNLSETLRPLQVENLNISRVVQRVKRFSGIEMETEELLFCVVIGCGNQAKIHLKDKSGKDYYFCKKHAKEPLEKGFVRARDG